EDRIAVFPRDEHAGAVAENAANEPRTKLLEVLPDRHLSGIELLRRHRVSSLRRWTARQRKEAAQQEPRRQREPEPARATVSRRRCRWQAPKPARTPLAPWRCRWRARGAARAPVSRLRRGKARGLPTRRRTRRSRCAGIRARARGPRSGSGPRGKS